ncbi:MAG: hypothetical protein ACYC61_26060 [Isosphaeraceae bacterium]
MNARIRRSRRAFRIESLEIRNAPSHIGGLGHVAAALHKVHGPAHVRTFRDTSSVDRKNPLDRNTGVEHSTDTVVEKHSTDPSAGDTTPNDISSLDRSGQS